MSTQASEKHLAIVGAGLIGLCSALEAQRKGYKVTLFDKTEPGMGASFGNGGYLATELMAPLSTPSILSQALKLWLSPNGPLALPIRYWHKSLPWIQKFIWAARPSQVKKSSDALGQLNAQALPAWQRCLADIDAQHLLKKDGYILLWESKHKIKAAKAHQQYLLKNGIENQWLNRQDIEKMEPNLAPIFSHGLYFPNAHRVQDPFAVSQRLFQAFCQRGGKFKQSRVKKITAHDTGVELHCEQDQQTFDALLICSGAWSQYLLGDLGIKVPLEAERGYHLSFDGLQHKINRPLAFAQRNCLISPLSSGLRLVGITELAGLKLKPFAQRFRLLNRHAKAVSQFIGNHQQQPSQWMGHRPTLPDSLPVIDVHPKFKHIAFAFGHQHLGLTQAAITAELVMAKLNRQCTLLDTRPYSITRFNKNKKGNKHAEI